MAVGDAILRHHMTSCDQEEGREAVLARLFPNRGEVRSLDKLVHDAVLSGAADDEGRREALCGRIGDFFAQREVTLADSQVVGRTGAAAGLSGRELCAAMVLALGEILEMAGDCARDHRRDHVCPCDLRLTVALNDPELEAMFGRCRVLWTD